MRMRRFRQFLRDWFCMHVLAYWLRYAESDQLYELGGEMVRTAWERDNPESDAPTTVRLRWSDASENVGMTLDFPDEPRLQAGQKWMV